MRDKTELARLIDRMNKVGAVGDAGKADPFIEAISLCREAATLLSQSSAGEGMPKEPKCMPVYRGSKSDNDICNVVRYADALRAYALSLLEKREGRVPVGYLFNGGFLWPENLTDKQKKVARPLCDMPAAPSAEGEEKT